MMQTYQGYFQNGRFVSPDIASIPDNVDVLVTVMETPNVNKRSVRIIEELCAMARIDEEPISDDDIATLNEVRISFRKDIDE